MDERTCGKGNQVIWVDQETGSTDPGGGSIEI